MNDNKEKKQIDIGLILKEIEKEFGKESIMLLGEEPSIIPDTFSSGSLCIDNILGIGGWPKGRIIEIFGPESSGKTTLALHAIAEIQKTGGIAAFIDAEHSIDPIYARNLGVDIKNLILAQPSSGEEALEIVDRLVKTGAIDLIVVDSVAALVPEVELNGEMRDQTIGAQARLMSKALRKITGTLSKNKTAIIFLNQIREKIGVLFGNPETTTGGKALKFYSSIRLEVRKVQNITNNGDITGNQIKCKVVKNKLAPPYKSTQIEIIFSKGISKVSEVIQLAEAYQIINRRGSWYSYNGENIAQGQLNLSLLLQTNKNLYDEIYNLVIGKLSND
ncbi:recombinase RecA [Metamycoplasma auris]|uniref:Protein RecA n=1 Tax=Metamycoplasma auris TaxID=51363 RepID=A0A2W7G4B6_9BACT|nr:recombinase RecA [Metamycoplasma auris]PZV99934.1 recombination protein RecA [Metamycoplasma auris]